MNNADLSTLLIECADKLQERRNEDLTLGHLQYAALRDLELRAREAAVEVEKSRELNPLGDI